MLYPLPDPLNHFTHVFSANLTWWTFRIGFERVRRRAGIPKQKLYWPFENDPLRPRTPVLCAWNPSVLLVSSDWPPYVHVTGYYLFPRDHAYRWPAELLSFFQEGEPSICVTFRSMVHRERAG